MIKKEAPTSRHGPRRCVVCRRPGFGDYCSPGCSAMAAVEEAIDAGCFPRHEIARVRTVVGSLVSK
jgi:hypothetical protein